MSEMCNTARSPVFHKIIEIKVKKIKYSIYTIPVYMSKTCTKKRIFTEKVAPTR